MRFPSRGVSPKARLDHVSIVQEETWPVESVFLSGLVRNERDDSARTVRCCSVFAGPELLNVPQKIAKMLTKAFTSLVLRTSRVLLSFALLGPHPIPRTAGVVTCVSAGSELG